MLWILAAVVLFAAAFVAIRWVAQTRETAARASRAYHKVNDVSFPLSIIRMDQLFGHPPRDVHVGQARYDIEKAKQSIKPTLAKSTLAQCALAQPDPPGRVAASTRSQSAAALRPVAVSVVPLATAPMTG